MWSAITDEQPEEGEYALICCEQNADRTDIRIGVWGESDGGEQGFISPDENEINLFANATFIDRKSELRWLPATHWMKLPKHISEDSQESSTLQTQGV